jgi:hypothetical protein
LAQIGLDEPFLARLDPIIAQKSLRNTGKMRFLVKIFFEEYVDFGERPGAETQLIDGVYR